MLKFRGSISVSELIQSGPSLCYGNNVLQDNVEKSIKTFRPEWKEKINWQKHVCFFLRNEYFGKYGWFKGKRVHFNVMVIENKTFLPIKYAYQGQKNWRHLFREQNVTILMI